MAMDTELLADLAAEHGTPLYVYDLVRVQAQLEKLRAFDVVRYAQKANGCRPILELLAGQGASVDAVSAGELERALAAGFPPSRISYTSDVFTHEALDLVQKHRISSNLGSADMIEQLASRQPEARVTLRINPGFGAGHHKRVATGGATSKHGIWHGQLEEALTRCSQAGLVVGGLHVHLGSGAERTDLERSTAALEAALLLAPESVDTLSTGGGLPVPYEPGEAEFDVESFAEHWEEARARWQEELGRNLTLEVEPGRFLVAQAGVLLTEVRARKSTEGYRYLLVDAGFHTLLRPTLYGAYHRISAPGLEEAPTAPRVVAGPLCESADVLTQGPDLVLTPQELPDVPVGGLLAIHDVGAYGAVMASNYNSMPLPAEVVVGKSGPRLARPRQTTDELLGSARP